MTNLNILDLTVGGEINLVIIITTLEVQSDVQKFTGTNKTSKNCNNKKPSRYRARYNTVH